MATNPPKIVIKGSYRTNGSKNNDENISTHVVKTDHGFVSEILTKPEHKQFLKLHLSFLIQKKMKSHGKYSVLTTEE